MAILVSVISASYYLQIIKVIHFPSLSEPLNETEKVAEVNSLPSAFPIQNPKNIVNFPSATTATTPLGGSGRDDYTPIKITDKVQVTNIHSMTISVLTLTIWMFIFNPSLILNSTHLLALSIFNI